MLTNRRRDILGGCAWLVTGAAIAVASARMDTVPHLGGTSITAPGLVPLLLGLVIAGLGCALVARALWTDEDRSEWLPHVEGSGRRVALALALVVIYALGLIGRMPFLWASAIFVTVFVLAFQTPRGGPRQIVQGLAMAAAVGFGSAFAVVVVFERLFLVRLP